MDRGIPQFLASGYFVQVHPEIVKRLNSASQALVLQKLSYWLERSDNELDGYYWVYKTYSEWSEELGLTPNQVERAVTALEKNGVIITTQPEKYNRRKWYRIDASHELFITNSPNSGLEVAETRHQKRKLAISTNTTKNTTNSTHKLLPAFFDEDFDEFWMVYPKKVEKKKAKAAFIKALHKASATQIIAGVANLRFDDIQYCPNPTTYLNGERWCDEPAPRKLSKEEQRQLANQELYNRLKSQEEGTNRVAIGGR